MNINRENARAVHTQILLHPETHNQDVWLRSTNYTAESCGTVACVAGWAAMLDPRNKVVREPWSRDGITYGWSVRVLDGETGEDLVISEAGDRALGFEEGDREADVASCWMFAAERTREEVLAQLDHMANTGEFNWDLVPDEEDYR